MRAAPRPQAAASPASRRRFPGRSRRSVPWLGLLLLAVVSSLRAALPQNPLPAAIELHPPFRGRCWGLAASHDGVIAAGTIGSVALFDGIRWRSIPVPANIEAARALVLTDDKLWVGGRGRIGWIARHSTDVTFHPVVTDIPGEVFYFKPAGNNLLAASLDTILLISPDGRVLDRTKLAKPARRFLSTWGNGWLLTGSYDAFFIQAGERLSITDRTPVDHDALVTGAIISAVTVDDTTYLVGGRHSYRLRNGELSLVDLPDWLDLSTEHLITVFRSGEPDSPLIRLSLDGGLKAFDPHTLSPLWQLRPGEDMAGTPTCTPVMTAQGIFVGADTCIYWLPSTTSARRLTTPRQLVQNVVAGHDGFWVCTSEGSWFAPNAGWTPMSARPGSTTSVAELPLGTVRGLFRSLDVNGRVVLLEPTGAQTLQIAPSQDGFVLNQVGRLSRWTSRLEKVDAVDLLDGMTSMVVAPDSTVYAGTMSTGVLKWPAHGGMGVLRNRGSLRSLVASHPTGMVVLWSDGLLEIGSEQVQLPDADERYWTTPLSLDSRTIAVGGEFGGGGAILLVEKVDDHWSVRPLEHPLLDGLSHVDSLAASGDWLGISGPGAALAVRRSFFPPSTPVIAPTVARIDAAAPNNGRIEIRRVVAQDDQVRLRPGENEIRFGIRGREEYWSQRIRMFYRLLPGTGEWTPIDFREKVVLQRIDAGMHVLEVRSTSVAGSTIGRLAIIRPPFWYASNWAYAAYLAAAVGLGIGGSIWRTRRLAERARILEERVARRTDELRKANEAKSEFLASMSHEIRNPLNGVIGLSAMLRESARSERDRRLTDTLRACADQLRLVLDDILDFSAIERGEIRVQSEVFDAGAAIRAAVLAVDPKLERTMLTIGPAAEHAFIRGDEGKLRQIVTNLVSNALKYGVPAEAQVDVTLDAGRLVVAVRNTGPDIPKEDLERIFVAFERGRSTTHQYVRGTGLGLTVSARFARAMGGGINVLSDGGQTRFTLSIPIATADAPVPRAVPSAPPRINSVLGIEDEPYNRLVLGHVLNGFGCSVDWAQSGAEALEILASRQSYDVIFTDWMLPDMQGDELVGRIRHLCGSATPTIIAVTAYATAEKRAEALAAGVAAFVTKPITREKVEIVLSAAQTRTAASAAEDPGAEPLRLGLLTDGPNPAAQLQDYRTELLKGAQELDDAVQDRDSTRAAQTAHRLASQLLAIHHHSLADGYRDIEAHASRSDWNKVVEFHTQVGSDTAQLSRRLAELAEQITAEATKA